MTSQQEDLHREDNDHELSNLIPRMEKICSKNSQVFRKKLVRWVIRTALGAALFGFLAARYSWGKYVLYFWIPLAALSLLAIILGKFILERKVHQMQTLLETQLDPPSK